MMIQIYAITRLPDLCLPVFAADCFLFCMGKYELTGDGWEVPCCGDMCVKPEPVDGSPQRAKV